MGFTRAQLEAARTATVPDLVGPDLRLLFIGINPGLWTAAAQAHVARRGNRFYPAIYAAGITDRLIDASDGYRPDDAAHLIARGVGITNLVARATARADELSTEELRAGARELERKVRAWRPRVAAVVGVTAYRVAFERPRAVLGRQQERVGGAELWVLPNPSGLNAHHQPAVLAEWFRHAAAAAGVIARSAVVRDEPDTE